MFDVNKGDFIYRGWAEDFQGRQFATLWEVMAVYGEYVRIYRLGHTHIIHHRHIVGKGGRDGQPRIYRDT